MWFCFASVGVYSWFKGSFHVIRSIENHLPLRLFWIFLGLTVLFLIPFLIWGKELGALFAGENAVRWMEGFGMWAWAPATGLLIADLFLPIPATAVMAALGFIYGPLLGGLIGAAGSFASGSLAYGLCRCFGRGAALRIAGADGLHEGERLFRNFGGWLVALSRWLPLFPEVIACMAGLTRMPGKIFFMALACGCLPMGLTFAAVGHAGNEHPRVALLLSALLPPILWLVLGPVIRRGSRPRGSG
jgi:uncharacterized membrane protein YdjX (TVP38/TMEM64 family)